MTIATGIAKRVTYKKEVTMGLIPAATAPLGQSIRRLSSNLDLKKATYKSNEIRTDYQISDFRHGVRSVDGTLAGELSVGTYGDFIATACRQLWQTLITTGPIALLSSTLTTALVGTITTTGTSFLTLGFKVGDVVRTTGWTTTATNLNSRNMWITALTATVMTVQFIDGNTALPFQTKVAGDTVTLVQAGKKTWVPVSGQTNESYSIEHWFSDIGQSEVFSGCRIKDLSVKLPATGFCTIDISMMGLNMLAAQSQYFTTPLAPNTGGTLASVNGALYMNGAQVGLITSMDVKIDAGMTSGGVVGQNIQPDIFAGNVDVSGSLTVYFQDAILRDLFVNETECALMAVFTTNNTANADFLSIVMPRIKVGGASKDDGEKGLTMTMPYQALININGGAGIATNNTTIGFQDSTVP